MNGSVPYAVSGRERLLRLVPGFAVADETLVALAEDPGVSPEVFERVCEAIFALVDAYLEAVAK